ncbi:hypothetical protein COLO4_37532 [Corchorus olitorius]|uniref:Uncharacterized protein n=1 Tax=Corchorus olitorius TaxID=93759 RepID=A0A1R3G0Z4_9ROSI|nr:hypothetical protein COLO4_37532 [Corchorus olitorius]
MEVRALRIRAEPLMSCQACWLMRWTKSASNSMVSSLSFSLILLIMKNLGYHGMLCVCCNGVRS